MMRESILDLLFPQASTCPLCQQNPEEFGLPCCSPCLKRLGLHWQKIKLHAYDAYALTIYGGFAKEVLHEIKFEGKRQAALAFGRLLGLAIKEEPYLQGHRLLLPIPLHPNRLRQRGFNQTQLLADGIRQEYPRVSFVQTVRTRDTLPQNQLLPVERQKNIHNAFLIPHPKILAGKRVLIVDDIFTTGLTFKTMATQVAAYGGRVSGVFVAKAVD